MQNPNTALQSTLSWWFHRGTKWSRPISNLGCLASVLAKDEQPILHHPSHRKDAPTEGAKEPLGRVRGRIKIRVRGGGKLPVLVR